MNQQIAMLWMRGSLSFLEQLCIRSFQDVGHHVVLYHYGEVHNVPDGVELRDARDVLSERDEIVHSRSGSPAPHADLFRYRLLSQVDDLIWADTDAYCCKPFQTDTGHFYGWESDRTVNIGVLGLPRDSETLARLVEFTSDEYAIPTFLKPEYVAELEAAKAAGKPVHVGDQVWAVWGPKAFTHFLQETGEIRHALPQHMLYPVHFRDRRFLTRAGHDHNGEITDETFSIHIYGRRMRARVAEKDKGIPHPRSLLGELLLKHRIDPCEAPLPKCPVPDRDSDRARVYREAVEGKVHPVAEPSADDDQVNSSNVRVLDQVVAVTTMKNEGAFILDWIAYHMRVGITHFLVYTNDCDDQTNDILDALAKRGVVTRIDNPANKDAGERPQRVALELARNHPKILEADAVVVMDVDEYINIHVGTGTLMDLFEKCGDPDMISMTWRLFGCGAETGYRDEAVATILDRAAPHHTRKPHQSWGLKTIFRKGVPFDELGVHRPRVATGEMPKWVNGSGDQMPDSYLEDGWRSTKKSWGYDYVTLNHYAVRNPESFLVKRDRGRTNHISRPQGEGYWAIFNRNDEEDATISANWRRARPLSEAFRRDPVLGPLHDAAVQWHEARIAELKLQTSEAELFDAISCLEPTTEADDTTVETPAVSSEPSKASSSLPLRDDAPATGLAADEVFRSLMARVQQKQEVLTPLPVRPRSDRIVIVTSMKNESCFILEWIAYHLSIGVTHFLVYTNDCDDPTNAVLDQLSTHGLVTRVDNPFNREAGQKPQRGALNDAINHPKVTEADWVGVIDVDEFVNIHVGDGTFSDLLSAAGDPNVISMTWRFFGNRGLNAYEDVWQTEAFTACAPKYLPKPRLGWGFKSFQRLDSPFSKLGVHRPLDVDETRLADVRWVNGAGRVMPERTVTKNEWFSRKDTIGYDLVTLNHYVLRSAESFLVKRQRGRINHVDQDQGAAYWTARNYATETDASIHARLPRAKAHLDLLLADDALARLHAEAVAWHRLRIKMLLAEPDYRALYDAITDPMQPDAIWRERPVRDPAEAAE